MRFCASLLTFEGPATVLDLADVAISGMHGTPWNSLRCAFAYTTEVAVLSVL